MRGKLFTPFNVGAFDLRHRIVLEWPPAIDPIDVMRNPFVPPSDPHLMGGLVICDPGRLIWPRMGSPHGPGHIELSWPSVIKNAKLSLQFVLARLRADLSLLVSDQTSGILALTHSDIANIIRSYVDAAHRAKSLGFDGIELDCTFGSVTDLFLMPSNRRTDRYGGAIAQRCNFVMELVEAVTEAFGRDRVAIRLSPFRDVDHSNLYAEALRHLYDQEIAYISLELTDQYAARILRSSSSAKVLRCAYPGIFITSGQHDLVVAMELVESRWADAVCFSGSEIDAQFLSQLRHEGLGGADAQDGDGDLY
jgi:N-ethylmaleimide reductase